MPNAPRPAREFCTSCGYPLRGSPCEACGFERAPLALRDGDRRRSERAPEVEETAGLEAAFEAWRARDYPSEIGILLESLGAPATSLEGQDGPAWIATLGRAVAFFTCNIGMSQLVIEVPAARLPLRQRVGVMRLALEIGNDAGLASRICLRGDLMLARTIARLPPLSPAQVRDMIYETAALAVNLEQRLMDSFDARSALTEEQRSEPTWEALGRPRKLTKVAAKDRSMAPPPIRREEEEPTQPILLDNLKRPGSAPRPSPPPPRHGTVPMLPKALPVPSLPTPAPPPPPPPPPPSVPQIAPAVPHLTPPPRRSPPPARLSPPPIPATATEADLPPILSPSFAAPPAPVFDERKRQTATVPEPMLRAQMPGSQTGQRAVRKASKASLPAIDFDAVKRPSSGDGVVEPEDRLCELFEKALALAATIGTRSDSTRWLLRATAFRAFYEFHESVPDAVALFYRATARDPHSPEIPIAVLEKIVASRAAVAKEKPLNIDPMTSATQAKDHAARYLTEIDAAPPDPTLRHFLALGALAELMVRTKLPGPTEQRLREIVAHARREGPRGSAIELLMTALERIVSG